MFTPYIGYGGYTKPIHKARDNSFKLILGDYHLFVSFLRDFIHIDTLKDVQAEDIEDISERFLSIFQDNRDSDTVKRINLKEDTPLFVIAVIEHESMVNYRAPFRMLQHIILVLDKYEKEVNRKHPDLISRRDFRYPPVLPIIFYDGTSPGPWNVTSRSVPPCGTPLLLTSPALSMNLWT